MDAHQPGTAGLLARLRYQGRPDIRGHLGRVTTYALYGAMQECTPGLRTQRYQHIVVAALDAVHESGAPAPDDFLGQLAAVTADRVAPRPK